MFGKEFQRKYALSDQGIKNTKKGTFWTVIVNLVVMGGMGIQYLLMDTYMNTLTEGQPLPAPLPFIVMVCAFLILSLVTHLQQYRATYGLVYGEVKDMRIGLAERLRKLPLGYFGKRDLADLTETIMGDVNRLEHVWSHCLGYLYGSLEDGHCLPLGCAGGFPAALREPENHKKAFGDYQGSRDPGIGRHPGDTGKHPRNPCHKPGKPFFENPGR